MKNITGGQNLKINILIVRHGETLWNNEGKFQGSKDVDLSKTGMRQAACLAYKLRHEKIDTIYTSALKRAITTSRVIAKKHKTVGIIKNKLLNEKNHGLAEGKTYEEVLGDPYIYNLIKNEVHNSRDFKFPEGESKNNLRARIEVFFDYFFKEHNRGTFLIVTHGGAIKEMLRFLIDDKKGFLDDIKIKNCSISKISIEKNNVKLIDLNNDSYLNTQ